MGSDAMGQGLVLGLGLCWAGTAIGRWCGVVCWDGWESEHWDAVALNVPPPFFLQRLAVRTLANVL